MRSTWYWIMPGGRSKRQGVDVGVTPEQIDQVVAAVRTGASGDCTGVDGRAAMEIAIAIHQSHTLGRPVKLALVDRSTVVLNV